MASNNENRQTAGRYGPNLGMALALLPTPAVNDMGAGYTPEGWDAWTAAMKVKHDNGNGHGKSLSIEARRSVTDWGKYKDAIERAEDASGRPAPSPVEDSPKGGTRLSPAFAEFMMMLPAGWVTDVPGITRTESLKALGNGVVPAQAYAALSDMLSCIPVTSSPEMAVAA